MNKLYSNIGNKLQLIAKICGIIGLFCATIGLFAMIFSDHDALLAGIFCIISGVVCLVGSWPLYAFGQLVNDVHSIKASVSENTEAEPFELPEI